MGWVFGARPVGFEVSIVGRRRARTAHLHPLLEDDGPIPLTCTRCIVASLAVSGRASTHLLLKTLRLLFSIAPYGADEGLG